MIPWRNVIGQLRRFSVSVSSGPAVFIDSLPISEYLRQALRDLKIHKLTDIQQRAFAPIVKGESVVAVAPTGTGKTFAYAVPVLSRIHTERWNDGDICIIVVPTHELVQQVASVVVGLDPNIRVEMVFGKDVPFNNRDTRKDAVTGVKEKPAQIVIGTAGKIASNIKSGKLKNLNIKTLVIDEIDSLLVGEYKRELVPLLSDTRMGILATTQLVCVGATWSSALATAVNEISSAVTDKLELLNVSSISCGKGGSSRSSSVQHYAVMVTPDTDPSRVSALVALITSCGLYENSKWMVFANSAAETKSIVNHHLLRNRALALHGDLKPVERRNILNTFRASNAFPILVATDVAARGIDVPNVSRVVHFHPPTDHLGYVHRAGRTGRLGGGKSKPTPGESIVFYSSKDEKTRIEEIQTRLPDIRLDFSSRSIPSHNDRSLMATESVLREAVKVGSTDSVGNLRRQYLERQLQLHPNLTARVAATCLTALLGPLVETVGNFPKRSILSGTTGFTPVLFVDPGRTILQSRGDLLLLLDSLNFGKQVGVVALSESGFLVDLPSELAQQLCMSSNDVVSVKGLEMTIPKHLPKLLADESIAANRPRRKAHLKAIPWRRHKPRSTSSKKTEQ